MFKSLPVKGLGNAPEQLASGCDGCCGCGQYVGGGGYNA